MVKHAPWTDDEVQSLNDYQQCGVFHEFNSINGVTLIATRDGWVEKEGGPVVQMWCHPWMADGQWRESLAAFKRWLRGKGQVGE